MRKNIFVLSVISTILVSGCGNMLNGKSLADDQIIVFHDEFNKANWDAILNAAHSDMFKDSSKEEAIELFDAVNRKLGKVNATKTINFNVNSMNGITTVVLVKETTYEEGKGVETFTYRISNETASLVGWSINSNDLIIK